MLYTWPSAQNEGNKERVLLCLGNVIKKYIDPIVPFKYLRFVILDVLTNTKSLSKDDIEDLLLEKETFLCGTLVTQHKGINESHDWDRVKQTKN